MRILRCAFRTGGLASPELDARVLLLAGARMSLAEFARAPRQRLAEDARLRLAEMMRRRLDGEPVARILGHREFWSFSYRINGATLVPRPETETVVEVALELVRRAGEARGRLRIADLGTGSGCILISLLRELPNAVGIGTDISCEALAVARENAGRAGVGARAHFLVGDYSAALGAGVDLVVANPPYVRSRDIAGLAAEVRNHDPVRALDGGRDGLAGYRAIARDLERICAAGGLAVFEVGAGQGEAVRAMLARCGMQDLCTWPDLSGTIRVVSGRWRPARR